MTVGTSKNAAAGKDDDVVKITAYDASLVLQAAAGSLSLSDNQVRAADVNRNGSVSCPYPPPQRPAPRPWRNHWLATP